MSSLNDAESCAFLRALFPGGLRDSGLLAELCPEGWGKSPLFPCFHPPPAMAYREYLEHRETKVVGRLPIGWPPDPYSPV